MIAPTARVLPPSSVSRELTYALCLVCKDWYTIKEIDAMFVFSGADDAWWVEPQRNESSSRFNRVQGWLEGIRVHAPASEIDVFRGVVEKVLHSSDRGSSAHDSMLMILSKLDGVPLPPMPKLEKYNLDPAVTDAAGKLFESGHYRQAVLDAFIALNSAVQAKSGRSDIDGTPLMQTVFSVNNPILSLSDDKNEQLGNMHLFAGAILAIRNPRAHNLDENDSRVIDETLELLAFASYLFRQLARSQVE